MARLRRHREAFLKPRIPERCLVLDGSGRLIAVEVEVQRNDGRPTLGEFVAESRPGVGALGAFSFPGIGAYFDEFDFGAGVTQSGTSWPLAVSTTARIASTTTSGWSTDTTWPDR